MIRPGSAGAGALKGAAAGAAGILAGHAAVLLAHRWTGDADYWLKGPHGPPFFDVTLSTAAAYAFLGAALGWPDGAGRLAWTSAAAAFAVLAGPMGLATRVFSWGEAAGAPQTMAWFYLVLACYAASNLAGAAVLGAGPDRPPRWRGASGAAAGLAAGYLLQWASQWVYTPKEQILQARWLAPPFAVFWGAASGGAIGVGRAWARR